MPTKSKSRPFPKDKNSLLHPADDRRYPSILFFFADAGIENSLIRKCKEQKVVFDAFSVFVLRLKLPVPASPDSDSVGERKFITRMRDTDFFQALSMFHTFDSAG
jgi:hypothetical protein